MCRTTVLHTPSNDFVKHYESYKEDVQKRDQQLSLTCLFLASIIVLERYFVACQCLHAENTKLVKTQKALVRKLGKARYQSEKILHPHAKRVGDAVQLKSQLSRNFLLVNDSTHCNCIKSRHGHGFVDDSDILGKSIQNPS